VSAELVKNWKVRVGQRPLGLAVRACRWGLPAGPACRGRGSRRCGPAAACSAAALSQRLRDCLSLSESLARRPRPRRRRGGRVGASPCHPGRLGFTVTDSASGRMPRDLSDPQTARLAREQCSYRHGDRSPPAAAAAPGRRRRTRRPGPAQPEARFSSCHLQCSAQPPWPGHVRPGPAGHSGCQSLSGTPGTRTRRPGPETRPVGRDSDGRGRP
jgi:hypothetical protein